jgi:hypothetical protein
MKDASFKVYRGSDQSVYLIVTDGTIANTRLNLTGKSVRAVIRPSEDVPPLISKLCRAVVASTGEVALDLTPAESRLIPLGRKVQVEFEVLDNGKEIPVGIGIITGIGGINLDG